MSKSELHEFNLLNKMPIYRTINNRIAHFRIPNENSLLLKKVLQTKLSKKKEEFLGNKELTQNNIIFYKKPKYIQIKTIQRPVFKVKKKQNNTIDNSHKNNNYNIENGFMKNNLNDKIKEPNNFRKKINDIKIFSTPKINNKRMATFSNLNNTDSDSEVSVLNYKGRKIFTINSFAGIKNRTVNQSPINNSN